MQSLITQHTNPMHSKRPFIKKSRPSNLSFITKPSNLSMTKASNRFSLDKTFTYSQQKPYLESYIKTAREPYQKDFRYPEILQEFERPQTTRAQSSMSKNNFKQRQFQLFKRRKSLKNDQLDCHKQKLYHIIKSIDLNNSMIAQLFECEEEIDFFKQEIHKTIDLNTSLHLDIQKKIQHQRRIKGRRSQNLSFSQKNQLIEDETLCNKLQQLRMKKSLFRDKQHLRLSSNSNSFNANEMNKTFT